MATQDRTTARRLELYRALKTEAFGFGFFRALRRIECVFPDQPRIGESLRAADDPIRLAQEPSLAFAPSALSSFRPGKGGSHPRLQVLFFGSFGPNGPLPLHLTEYARDRLRNHNDPTFARFLDLFHHRFLCLFYRAWASARPTVGLDRPDSDRFGAHVASLFGTGMPSLRARDEIADLAKLHYAAWLSSQTPNAEGLQAVLQDYFKVPIAIEEFVAQWLEIPIDSRCYVGQDRGTGTLGRNAIIGARVCDRQHNFRIVLGPVCFADYQRFLPGGKSLSRLVAWVRNYIGDELHWELQLLLKKEEVPALKLGEVGQLGWTTWTLSRPLPTDADDLHFSPLSRAV